MYQQNLETGRKFTPQKSFTKPQVLKVLVGQSVWCYSTEVLLDWDFTLYYGSLPQPGTVNFEDLFYKLYKSTLLAALTGQPLWIPPVTSQECRNHSSLPVVQYRHRKYLNGERRGMCYYIAPGFLTRPSGLEYSRMFANKTLNYSPWSGFDHYWLAEVILSIKDRGEIVDYKPTAKVGAFVSYCWWKTCFTRFTPDLARALLKGGIFCHQAWA